MAAASPPLAKLQNVRKSFASGGRRAEVLSDVSLEIHAGEFASLIGPSGSGKSTILNLLAGIDSPSAGTVDDADGRQPHVHPAARGAAGLPALDLHRAEARLALPYGFVGAVAAEMMASNQGSGFLTQVSTKQFNTAGVFAALFALMAGTTLLNEGLGWLERRLFRWR